MRCSTIALFDNFINGNLDATPAPTALWKGLSGFSADLHQLITNINTFITATNTEASQSTTFAATDKNAITSTLNGMVKGPSDYSSTTNPNGSGGSFDHFFMKAVPFSS